MRSRQALFQRVSASLIIPITFLPLAAIFLAAGSQLGIGPLEAAGRSLIQLWLPLFFGVGISIGFTDGDGMGVLSVVAGFLTMSAVAERVAGDPTLNVGVLGGIVTGAVCTWAFNRVKDASLPEYLALFSGKRLGPMAGALAGLGLGYLFGIFWPPIHQAIVALGAWLYGAGGVGVFAYGALLRVLIPTGLHHILMQLIDYQIGGWLDPVTGKMVAGEYVRFLAGDPAAGRILSGFFLTLGFGPLGAALAITHEAKPGQRRRVGGLMTTAALTAMLLGVTEPVEFAFIFASPLLFGVHIVLSGLASLVAWALNIHLGGYALPMILINWHRQQNGWLLIPLGLAFTALYYVTFRAVIRWRRPPILGQVEEEEPAAAAPVAAEGEAALLLAALGGAENIRGLNACMTRLRLVLADPATLDEPALRRLGASAVLRQGGGDVQVVMGARA
ncbi:MAG TPA: PTS transporter subunit EIIC, partial [Symbiobacteriaceae bacterium]|nr:PTS transporter subunit EIIC [Symbiobacteriaceae bacterium]